MTQRTINHYQILDQLGQGGMATVFRAYDPRFKREVALKLLPHALMHDPTFRVRFEREAQMIAGLEHPAIVPVYDFGEAEGQPYLVMRLMTGGTLADRLAQGPLSVSEVARIFNRLAPALDAAHKQGIIHRDLKPGNILFDQWNEPYLADFGIAKLTDGDSTKALTATGGTMGTPAYMSPEQVQGGHLDGRSDVYALGVMLFEMLTGKRPYEATTPMAVALKHVTDPVPVLPKADLPPECQTVVNKALAKTPDHRYETASSLAQDVQALTGNQPLPSGVKVVEHPATEVMMPSFVPKPAAAPPLPSLKQPVAPPRPAPAAPSVTKTASERGRKLPAWIFGAGGVMGVLLCIGVVIAAAIIIMNQGDNDPTSTPPPVVADNVTPDTAIDTDIVDTATPETTPDEPPVNDAVATLEEVSQAVVQIVAQGTFRDPELGTLYNASGAGSGFIIDPSGMAVTNNHVVAGAAFLEVYVQGESTPRNARVVGVSECSDLAVIDIDGDGFAYLDWYNDPLEVGLDVYTAGFPLGNPEFTVTRGTLAKADANGETSWASVGHVIQHDATINPGNSGGPLVTPDGKVVGINYALAGGVDQYFAIAASDAQPILQQMQQGQNVTAIGINGIAVSDGQGLTGIWVTAVTSGSPAGSAGVRPGDIITMLEGFILATDGTMSSYCNILRGHNMSDVMSIEVLRYDTGEVLSGQLNGSGLQ